MTTRDATSVNPHPAPTWLLPGASPCSLPFTPAELAWLEGYAAGRDDAQREREGRLGVTRMQGGRK
jgi:hypothetical protein